MLPLPYPWLCESAGTYLCSHTRGPGEAAGIFTYRTTSASEPAELLASTSHAPGLGKIQPSSPVSGLTQAGPLRVKIKRPPFIKPPELDPVEMHSIQHGHCLYLPGKVEGGRSVRYLLDSGSSVNVLSQSTFNSLPRRIKERLDHNEITAALADGTGLLIYGFITLTCRICSYLIEIVFRVANISNAGSYRQCSYVIIVSTFRRNFKEELF